MVIYIAVLEQLRTISLLRHMLKDTLHTLVATLDLAGSDVVLTGALAWPQILSAVDGVAPWKMRIARHFPNVLYTVVMFPRLREIPDFLPHAAEVRDIRSHCVPRLLLYDVSFSHGFCPNHLRHCELVT